MKEIFITLLASLNVQALPDIHDDIGYVESANFCILENDGEAFYIEKCKSKEFPTETFHIYESVPCWTENTMGARTKTCEHKKHINLFVKGGEVFEIPIENLFDFYQIKTN